LKAGGLGKAERLPTCLISYQLLYAQNSTNKAATVTTQNISPFLTGKFAVVLLKIKRTIEPLLELARIGVHKREWRGIGQHRGPIDHVGGGLNHVGVSRGAVDGERKLAV
jgi:hypothetical protein